MLKKKKKRGKIESKNKITDFEKVHQQVRMPKKVKPGYKKKRKAEIDKKIRKAKRDYIAEIYKRKAKEKK